MLYNQYPQQYNRMMMMPTQSSDDIKMVNGIQSAEQYYMLPNSRTILMDSNIDRFYLKETDAAGAYRITAYDFKKAETPQPKEVDYVTREELMEVLKNYELSPKQPANDATEVSVSKQF